MKHAADSATRASLALLAATSCLVKIPPMRIATSGEQLPAANAMAGDMTYVQHEDTYAVDVSTTSYL